MLEVDEAIKTIPELDQILNQAVKSLKLDRARPTTIINNFNRLVVDLESTAFKIYKKYETKAFEKLAELWVCNRKDWISKILKNRGEDGVKDIISEFTKSVREMEFRAGQMRKARGGKTLEYAMKKLLNLANVPCEEPHKETKKALRRIDLVSPNAKTALTTPDKAVFIALKRTLRERWKQVVPEHLKGVRLYLVTLNGKLPEKKAEEIKNAGVIVYVRDELKKEPYLKDKPWVRKLSELPSDIKNAV